MIRKAPIKPEPEDFAIVDADRDYRELPEARRCRIAQYIAVGRVMLERQSKKPYSAKGRRRMGL